MGLLAGGVEVADIDVAVAGGIGVFVGGGVAVLGGLVAVGGGVNVLVGAGVDVEPGNEVGVGVKVITITAVVEVGRGV